jgi:TatA/E family protein of Tat protein translocase
MYRAAKYFPALGARLPANAMTLASLLDIEGPDLIVIFLIILILFGAKKLPKQVKDLGRAEPGRERKLFPSNRTLLSAFGVFLVVLLLWISQR